MSEGDFIYFNEDWIAYNKAPGLPSHGTKDSAEACALDAIAQRFPQAKTEFPDVLEGGLCHRLDNGTSGLLICAQNPNAKNRIRSLFQKGEIEKSYLAIVQGEAPLEINVPWPIAHHAKNKQKMAALVHPGIRYVRGQPKAALTLGTTLLSNARASLVRVRIGAGRRHQIRVHMAALGYPLIGDQLYNGPVAQHLLGHALHAESLELEGVSLQAPCPESWEDELLYWGLLGY